MLTREAILAVDDRKRESIDIPEWGGSVFVGTMSGTERDSWEQEILGENRVNARALLAVRVCVDEAGRRIFGDDDAVSLGEKSGAALERIAKVAQRLNLLRRSDVEDAKGNSEPDQSGSSTST